MPEEGSPAGAREELAGLAASRSDRFRLPAWEDRRGLLPGDDTGTDPSALVPPLVGDAARFPSAPASLVTPFLLTLRSAPSPFPFPRGLDAAGFVFGVALFMC